jgi:hypothetical protein
LIPALAAIALILVVGLPLAALLLRDETVDVIAGVAVLVGIATTAAMLLVISLLHAPWTLAALLLALAFVAAPAWLFAAPIIAASMRRRERVAGAPWRYVFHLASIVSLTGYALLATIAPLWEFDFIGDWGLKARVFFESGGVDWRFLQDDLQRVVHPDYPPLLPLAFDTFAIVRGAWDDRYVGLLNVAFAAAALLVVHRMLARELPSRTAAAFATFAMLPLAATPWIGIADGPLIAAVWCGLLLIRNGSTSAGAVLLGIGALTKNEGLTFIIAAAIGLAAAGEWRRIPRLWPAAVVAAPWLVLRSLYKLPTDLAEGNVVLRIFTHLAHPGELLVAVTKYPVGKPLFWVALTVGVVLVLRPILERERFLLTTVAVQFACYVAAYLATPHDVDWHVRWSWDRLISHLAPPLAYAVLAALLTRAVPAPDPSADRLRE